MGGFDMGGFDMGGMGGMGGFDMGGFDLGGMPGGLGLRRIRWFRLHISGLHCELALSGMCSRRNILWMGEIHFAPPKKP